MKRKKSMMIVILKSLPYNYYIKFIIYFFGLNDNLGFHNNFSHMMDTFCVVKTLRKVLFKLHSTIYSCLFDFVWSSTDCLPILYPKNKDLKCIWISSCNLIIYSFGNLFCFQETSLHGKNTL